MAIRRAEAAENARVARRMPFFAGAANAMEIYPVDRTSVLVGSKFDFKVEFDGVMGKARLTPLAPLLRRTAAGEAGW